MKYCAIFNRMDQNYTKCSSSGYICENEGYPPRRDTSSPNVHINPKIISSMDKLNANQLNVNSSSVNVHINPNFLNSTTTGTQTQRASLPANIESTQDSHLYINPTFIKRSRNISASSILHTDSSSKGSIHINPNFVSQFNSAINYSN